jgi:hypothetical protein
MRFCPSASPPQSRRGRARVSFPFLAPSLVPIHGTDVCSPPAIAPLYGQELDWTCWKCGTWLRLEHFWINGEMVGPSWDLV